MTKLPRFDVLGSFASTRSDQLVRPLSPTLGRLVEGTDEAKAHAGVAARYSEQRTKVAALREALTKAKQTDEQKERDALGRGGKVPRATAPAIADELEEAERVLGVMDGLLVEYSASLLRIAVAHLPEAIEQGQAVLDAALADLHEAIERAVATLATVSEAASEYGWVVGLEKIGHAYPFSTGRSVQMLPSVQEALARARASFDDDLQRRAEVVEKAEREAEVEAKKQLPPGQLVWKDGRSYRADEAGELVPVEQVER